MKRKIFAAVVALYLALTTAVPILTCKAAAPESVQEEDALFVLDWAGILTDEERTDLESRAQALTEEYQCGIYLISVDNFREYNSGSIADAAEWFYYEKDMGYGKDRDCSLLLLSVSNRNFCHLVHGQFGNEVFSDQVKEQNIEPGFKDHFKENDWYGGFLGFLDASEICLSKARASGVRHEEEKSKGLQNISMILLAPLLVAGTTCLILSSRMKSVHSRTEARSYVVSGSRTMRVQDDVYAYTATTVRHKKSSDRNSGGGDSFSSNSGSF